MAPIVKCGRCFAFAAAALVASAAWASAPPDDAAKTLDALFGERINRTESSDPAATSALAAELLAAARAKDVSRALLALLCERAYDLGAKHPDSHATAIAAMKLLADKVPEKADAAREKILNLYQAQYAKARGPDKSRAGEAMIDLLIHYGDSTAERRDYDAAVNLYRRALALAASLRGPKREELQAKLDFAMTRQNSLRKIERLQADLKADPKNQTARDEIVRLALVELNDTETAAKALNLDVNDMASKYVLLAGMKVENLPERACAELGDWFRSLAEKSGQQGRVAALVRAQGYYERFLALHQAADAARADVARALDEVDAVLAKIPGGIIKATVLKDPDFNSRMAPKFPPTGNVALSGAATASSFWGQRRPASIFSGLREGTQYALGDADGWLEAKWTPPARGRYILLVGRHGKPGDDPWGDATLSVNGGRTCKIEGMSSGQVCIVDLGLAVPVAVIRIEFKGAAHPGLAGLEIHARMGG